MTPKITILSLFLTLVTGAGLYIFVFKDENPPVVTTQITNNVADEGSEESENEQVAETKVEASDVSNKEETKPVKPVVKLNTDPVVSTAYGLTPKKPVKNGQTTSTTCTTDPLVECLVSFTNGSLVVEFDPQTTNSEGVALWTWRGGEDVPSGTWTVVAEVGNITSTPEVVYVQ